jgi:ribose transport system substrate-binding protein
MRLLRIAVVLAVSLLVVVSCAQESQTNKGGGAGLERLGRGEGEIAPEDIKIGLSTQDAENQYWLELADEFKKQADEKGVEVVFAAKYDPAEQTQIIENFIQQDVDAIAVSPVDPVAIQPVLKRAKEEGILVVNNHFPTPDPSAYDIFVDTGPYESGQIAGNFAADYINEEMGGEAKVALFTLPENETLTTRVRGITDALAEEAPNAEIVAKQRVQSQEDAVETTENILTANPDVDVWLGWSDFVMLGAVAGLEGAGENPADHLIVGIDGTCEAIDAMQKGNMTASVDNPPRPFAQLDFNIVFDMLTNSESPWNFVKHAITKLQVINETNLPEFAKRCEG